MSDFRLRAVLETRRPLKRGARCADRSKTDGSCSCHSLPRAPAVQIWRSVPENWALL